ncbi:MAG: acyltransferase [Comamonadaceae bacterium]|nr:MAG: acyltransferase [Comamonadaceae bacterium]
MKQKVQLAGDRPVRGRPHGTLRCRRTAGWRRGACRSNGCRARIQAARRYPGEHPDHGRMPHAARSCSVRRDAAPKSKVLQAAGALGTSLRRSRSTSTDETSFRIDDAVACAHRPSLPLFVLNSSRIDSLQGLRALAALLVVVSHQLPEAGVADTHAWFIGALGVQLFFVISGFIMITTSRDRFHEPRAPALFMWRRLVRIAPLYWLATLIYGMKLAFDGRPPALSELLKSLAFIPYLDDEGLYRPTYGLGWTLNHEMFFYALFAVALSQHFWRGVIGLLVTLVALVLFGSRLAPSPAWAAELLEFWANPVILYFVAGVLAGLLRQRLLAGGRLPADHAVSSFAMSTALLAVVCFLAADESLRRPMGMAACAVVFSLCAFRQGAKDTGWWRAAIVQVGNASYSIYLTHSFIARPIKYVWLAVWPDQHPIGMVCLIALAATALGLATYRWVEQPLMRLRWLAGSPRKTASAAVPGTATRGGNTGAG